MPENEESINASEPDTDHKPEQSANPLPPGRARYVWQRLWFQWVLGALVLFLLLSFVLPPVYWLLVKLSPVLTPVLLGLGLAYIFNPLTAWAQRRHGIKRPVSAGLMLGAVLLVLGITVPLMVVSGINQGAQLAEKAPEYAETALNWMGSDLDEAEQRLLDLIAQLDWASLDTTALKQALGIGAGAIFTGFGYLSYAAIFILVTAFCFFIFTWRLEGLKLWFGEFIPKPYRTETLRILSMMDDTVSAIVRGRLIQSLVVMILLCTGWAIVGVPYWLLLGVLGGLLNLLPFAAILSWPLAVVLTMVDAATSAEHSMIWAAVGPTIVYLIAQSMDGWVIEPLVQGKATGMDALTVLLVVLAGGALLGILGVVLAVPIAACIKILCQELVVPKLRKFAEDPPNLSQKGS